MKCIECGGELKSHYEEDVEVNMEKGVVSITNLYHCEKCEREYRIEETAIINRDKIETTITKCGYYEKEYEENE